MASKWRAAFEADAEAFFASYGRAENAENAKNGSEGVFGSFGNFGTGGEEKQNTEAPVIFGAFGNFGTGVGTQNEAHRPHHDEADSATNRAAAIAAYAEAHYDVAERVAIVMHGTGVAEEWAEAFAGLDASRPPSVVVPRDWLNMVNGAGLMLDRFGRQLSALGWTVTDLFGVHPEAPMQRHDCGGLVRFLADGSEVVAVTADTATLRNDRGRLLTYYRRPAPTGTACLWEIAR